MPINDFLPFGTAGGANVESQAAYAADPQRTAGFQTGVAPSAPFNKAWRQACFMASVIGQLIVDTLAADCLDNGNVGTHATQLSNTIKAIIATVGYAPLASPALTGAPTAPTVAGTSDSSTKIATTGFVQAVRALLAPLASPALTGVPTAPTAAPGTNTTQLATTAFVQAASALLAPLSAFVSILAAAGTLTIPVQVGGVAQTLYLKWAVGGWDPADGSEPSYDINWAGAFPNACLGALVTMEIETLSTGVDMWYQIFSPRTNAVTVQRAASPGGASAVRTRARIFGIGW